MQPTLLCAGYGPAVLAAGGVAGADELLAGTASAAGIAEEFGAAVEVLRQSWEAADVRLDAQFLANRKPLVGAAGDTLRYSSVPSPRRSTTLGYIARSTAVRSLSPPLSNIPVCSASC